MKRPCTKRIAILGSTGSVGKNALRIVADHRERFTVACLSAHRSAALLAEQVRATRPAVACLSGAPHEAGGGSAGAAVGREGTAGTAWFEGAAGILAALATSEPDLVLNAITGAAGLPASEWALREGIPLALANKESLVMAGPYLMALAARTGTPILPVDSEHCAIFQCLQGEARDRVRKIYLTASGGPFRTLPLDRFGAITPAEALRHPTWDMGPRISIGSATMMNKAFEILEAHWLFGFRPEQIEVLIHPQSIVHSMVEFVDGSITAQLGLPDMRVPIQYCLSFPDRLPSDFRPFDPVRWAQLTFEPVSRARYPAVDLAFTALAAGGTAGAVLNAADEVMTERFLAGEVPFPAIAATVRRIVDAHDPRPIHDLQQVFAADRTARADARHLTAP